MLNASERRDFRGEQPGVDADDSVFQRFRNAPDSRNVLGEKVGSQPVYRIVRKLDDFLFGFEFEKRSNRTEGLVMRDEHVLGYA